MKAALKTGMDALAVLWGLGVSSHAINKMLGLDPWSSRKTAGRFDSAPPHQFKRPPRIQWTFFF